MEEPDLQMEAEAPSRRRGGEVLGCGA